MSKIDPEKLDEVKKYIDYMACRIKSVADVAEKFDVDPRLLREEFKEKFNITPKKHLNNRKFKRLRRLLNLYTDSGYDTEYYVEELGFKSRSALNSFIKNQTDLTYNEYKEKIDW
ncbi:helix-turn-helix domain-containing protein [candidate division KSB1 bacterium]